MIATRPLVTHGRLVYIIKVRLEQKVERSEARKQRENFREAYELRRRRSQGS